MINQQLNEFIRKLSKLDTKNLSQKGLKAVEELGELAKVILPFDNAFATNHRFVDREKILEEIADSYLTIISIAYDLDFTDEEIENKIANKADKWAGLIEKEKNVKWPIPYEIHVTLKNVNKETFKNACDHMGIKPVILDIQDNDGNTLFHDVMTSCRFYGDNRSAYEEMKRISKFMKEFVGEVVREKIETSIWHPSAPQKGSDTMPPNTYFECHIGVVTNNSTIDLVKGVANLNDCHLSKNIFKKIDNDNYIMMMTYRTYMSSRETFESDVSKIIKSLDSNGLQYKNVTKEFSIYDTKISHDSVWINS